MEPKISIIVLNWNGKNDTLECLESIERIDYRNYEVILVDNGSTDDSAAAVRIGFPEVILIENKRNLGFSQGNNLGIRLALERQAGYLLILNNDTVVEPGILKELRAAIDSSPEKIILSPLIACYAGRRQLNFLGAKIDWGNGGYFVQYKPEDVLSAKGLLDIDYASGCALFFRPEAIEKAGFLEEKFFAYYEDIDWSFKCRRAGFKPKLYPKILVYHKCSRASGGAYSAAVYFYLTRNRLYFIRRQANFLRKLQFAFTYPGDSLNLYSQLLSSLKPESAQAVADGFWSALKGCYYQDRQAMPEDIKGHFGFLNKARLYFLTLKAVFFKLRYDEDRY